MTIDSKTAENDLAFIRAILDEDAGYDRNFGINYFAAGLLYGIQSLANGLLLIFEINAPTLVWLAIGILPTAIFLTINVLTVMANRDQPFGTGTAKRAIGGAFASAGIATIILAFAFGIVAFQKQDWTIWFMFPIVVCALQGAIWCLATIIRRRKWFAVVSAGWFVSAILLTACVDQAGAYVSALGLILLLLMAVPGAVMLRRKH